MEKSWENHGKMENYPLVICCIAVGKSPCVMGESTISMVIFNSYVKLPEGTFPRSLFGRGGSFLENKVTFPMASFRIPDTS